MHIFLRKFKNSVIFRQKSKKIRDLANYSVITRQKWEKIGDLAKYNGICDQCTIVFLIIT